MNDGNYDFSMLSAASELGGSADGTLDYAVGFPVRSAAVDDGGGASCAGADSASLDSPGRPIAPPVDGTMNYTQQAYALGMKPTVWERVKDAVAPVQTAVASPFQALGRSAAKAAGATETTASVVGGWLLPVVLVLVCVAGIWYWVAKGGRKSSLHL